jgi:formylglycine-generating enzyme required for sulfatase activity
MADIFIAYSKQDELFATRLAKSLTDCGASVFIAVKGSIPAGASWEDTIQNELDLCQIMLLIVTPDSMQSKNVRTEWRYFFDKDKPIIPIILERAEVSFQIRPIQYIDFEKFDYDEAFEQLYSELHRKKITLSNLAPTTPLVTIPKQKPLPPQGRRKINWNQVATVIVIPLFIAITAALIQTWPSIVEFWNNRSIFSPRETATLDIADIVATLDAQATIDLGTAYAQTALAQTATAYATGTQGILDQTATATVWTHTPTPDITASIDAYRTQQAVTVTAQYFFDLTATATVWTLTPTPTIDPLSRARARVSRNDDWIPYIVEFDGVEMVLVPAGCFTIGASPESDGERNGNEICFNEPFWIDRTEVTQEQFRRFDGDAARPSAFTGDNRPVENITWFEARAFCALREARLPTEPEWEYAARGPDELIYPWGNLFVAENVVYRENSDAQTATAGSRPAGASWVGALDISGNVWEWVSSLYQDYPYESDHESETNSADVRVLRGGSWFNNLTSFLRAAYRGRNGSNYRFNYVGFRCARDI